MKRICLKVSYDGTNYHGWQRQDNTSDTIEEVLNKALSETLGEPIEVIGASRTDAGVHALGNIAVFDTNARIPGEKVSFAVNKHLPEDIVVVESMEVEQSFHPRKCDSIKTYDYRISTGRFVNPTKRLYTYHSHNSFDVDRMRAGAGYLIGTHDFKSFCQTGAQVKDTVRTIYTLEVFADGDEIIIRVSGNGFLYNMVRIIAGTLMDIGMGRREPEDVKEMLAALDRNAAGPTAPACGLTLVSYEFL